MMVELQAVSLVSQQQRATQMRRRSMRKSGGNEVSIWLKIIVSNTHVGLD